MHLNLELSGISWRQLGSSGAILKHLESSEGSWSYLESCASICSHETSGTMWRHQESSGTTWRHGIVWNHLAASQVIWRHPGHTQGGSEQTLGKLPVCNLETATQDAAKGTRHSRVHFWARSQRNAGTLKQNGKYPRFWISKLPLEDTINPDSISKIHFSGSKTFLRG